MNTPSPSVEKSTSFYSNLGFTLLSMDQSTLVYDKNVRIIVDHSRKARLGFRIYSKDLPGLLRKLKSFQLIEFDDKTYCLDPNGILISLHAISEYPHPIPEVSGNSITGNFAGISIESLPFKSSIAFYEKLGCKITMGNSDGGWVQMNGFDIDISIMRMGSCPHLFHNPSLTYFNGKKGNPEVINKIRKSGVVIDEEITVFNDEGIVDNIILRDPGGLGFFIFND